MNRFVAPLAFVSVVAVSAARADLNFTLVSPRAHANSQLNTTLGAFPFTNTVTTGAFPSFVGSVSGAPASGGVTLTTLADYNLFLTPTQIIANGFAASDLAPLPSPPALLDANAVSESGLEIHFTIGGPHHVELHSIESQSSNAEGFASLVRAGHHARHSEPIFLYQHNHVHGVVYNLEAGDYVLRLVANTATSTANGGAASTAFYEIEFELFEGFACACDLNGDTFVDDADFVVFAAAYNELVCPPPERDASTGFDDRHAGCPADFDGNSIVDDADFVIFAAAYNELICP